MAVSSVRLFSLLPLLHTRFSSLHLFRRLALRHSLHLFLSPPFSRSSSFLPLRASHQSSVPLKWEEISNPPFPDSQGASDSYHPWPEWLEFSSWVNSSVYSTGSVDVTEFALELSPEFLRVSNGCLNFARDYPNIVWSLSKEDVEVMVDNGSPFLFKDALCTTKNMKSFLSGGRNDVLESDKPSTLDLMRFLLSYAYMAIASSENKPINSTVESSVRKLFGELVKSRGFNAYSNALAPNQFPEKYGEVPRSIGRNIEMKKGDWICPRCSFMNFAKNLKCRECEDPRPKKYLIGGEWECPQCNFFNFSRNAVCLRCDCKKPGQTPSQSLSSVVGVEAQSSSVRGQTMEKQQQWFANEIIQLEKSSDVSGSVEYGGFRGTMETRENSFALGARNVGIDGSAASTNPENTGVNINMEISQYMDKILDERSTTDRSNIGVGFSENQHPGQSKSAHDTCSPVHKKQNYNPAGQMRNRDTEHAGKSEEWFKKVAQLHDVEDMPGAVSDEDFPEITPMHKGENRFVVSKKKDRSLTSPMYNRGMAMKQQGSNNKYVPFGPFPPGYFAKDKSREGSKSGTPDSDRKSSPDQQAGALSSNSGIKDKVTNQVDISSNTMELTQRSSDLSSSSLRTSETSFSSDSSQSSESKNTWRGKSLEGSAVKEPEHLDMSEEAKAERWFQRVAQIKDISELSQIPDEDFPSIMPMRKGVNRFVVSKRKTPLERRLTSSRYRRNPPVVNSDPARKETDSD